MSVRACMNPEASNFGEDINGNFVGDDPNVLPFEPICRFLTEEEERAEDLGIEDYITEEEARNRPKSYRERNRSAYIEKMKTKTDKDTPLLGLGILAYIFMS